MPFRFEYGIDPAYDRLRSDDACEYILVESLDDVSKMPDPRQAPIYEGFVVGDAALFMLLERRGLEFESVLPSDVSLKLETQGVCAYFSYVDTPAGRKSVIAKVKEIIRAK